MKVYYVVVKKKPHFNRDDVREPYTESFLKMQQEKLENQQKEDLVMETKKLHIKHMQMVHYLEMLLKYLL